MDQPAKPEVDPGKGGRKDGAERTEDEKPPPEKVATTLQPVPPPPFLTPQPTIPTTPSFQEMQQKHHQQSQPIGVQDNPNVGKIAAAGVVPAQETEGDCPSKMPKKCASDVTPIGPMLRPTSAQMYQAYNIPSGPAQGQHKSQPGTQTPLPQLQRGDYKAPPAGEPYDPVRKKT